jgi:F0F1-type ATP synthase membrane subunit c/vacuolar-type H+-ATPase subunit K
MQNLSEFLEPIAAWFRSLGTPEPIVHWGHPVMMGIVAFVMGSYVGWTGWRSRTLSDPDAVMKNRGEHRKIAPLMFLFLAMGYTGGILSLVMQHQPILESPHFVTGSIVLALLTVNALLSAIGFGGENKAIFRSIHAYVGSGVLVLFLIHALLGLKLGLSI